MDRMSPQDASFLHVENEDAHMHISSVAVFEGPCPLDSSLGVIFGDRFGREGCAGHIAVEHTRIVGPEGR